MDASCQECSRKLHACDECHVVLCVDCDDCTANDAGTWCPECHETLLNRAYAEFGWVRAEVEAHVAACRALGLSTGASESQVLDAARGLK